MSQRFLLSRLSALGDVVCTLPVASCLKQGFPGCEIVWAVDPRFAGIVECCSSVDVIERVRPGLSPNTWRPIEGNFDAALDLQGLFKSGIIVAKAAAKVKLGYHWQRECAWLFSRRVLPDPTSSHVVDQYLDVARAVGCEVGATEFGLKPRSDDLDSVRGKLKEASCAGKFVVMNPGAGWVTKRWPAAHFAALIDTLQKNGVRAVLIGGPAKVDADAGQEVVGMCRTQPVNLTGKTSVRELVALISMGEAHVGGDTGSTHIAAALGRPAIGLYSITRLARSCPYGQIDRCHYDPGSLAGIRPDAVFKTLSEALV